MLYLVATPIGHLSDFSERAVQTCSLCDYLLCEDTRKSSILLRRYQINKPLRSYHLFNEASKLEQVLTDLKEGKNIALLSDGGTPLVCDPGELLIRRVRENQIPFTAIPGPCALIQALICSGLKSHPFQFLGFMPRKASEITQMMPETLSFPGTSVFYESPKRLIATLSCIAKLSPNTRICVARELTKTFEEVITLEATALLEYFSSKEVKGEIVILIEGRHDPYLHKEPKELVQELQDTYGLSLTDAIKVSGHLLRRPKQEIYKIFHSEK